MAIKLFDSELKVMDILWRKGDQTAKQIADLLREETGWNVNTTYTVIKKCVAKGAIHPTFSATPFFPRRRCKRRRPMN